MLFACGIVAARYLDAPALYLYVTVLALGLTLFATIWLGHQNSQPQAVILCLILICIGFVRYELFTGYFDRNHISQFVGDERVIAVSATVARYPERRERNLKLVLEVEGVFARDRMWRSSGRLLLTTPGEWTHLRYGDRLLIHEPPRLPGEPRNPGEFDYRAYLHAQGIFGTIFIKEAHQLEILDRDGGDWFSRKVVFRVKRYLDDFIARLPQKEASLLRGLLIGERGEIPFAMKEAFSKLGVVHILAVSGMHVGFVALIFMGGLGLFRVPYRARVILTLLALVFYAYLTNLKPPVVRASFMGALLLLGTILERRTDFYNSLAIAALLILALNPLELFQPGFQLSFSAVLSIVYVYPKLRAPFFVRTGGWQNNPVVRRPAELLLVSVAAFVGTMPFTMLYFGRLPNLSVMANLVIIPLVFVGVANAAVGAVLNLIWAACADLYLETVWLCLHSAISFVEWGSRLPLASTEAFQVSPLQVLAYFVGAILLFNLNYERSKRFLIIFVLAVLTVLVWQPIFSPSGRLRIDFIDVGQGDATLLTFPDGRHALIDGGKRTPYFDSGRRIVDPYLRRLGIRKLDVVILSHVDSDHLGGLPHILRNFQVDEVWDSGQGKDTQLYREYAMLVDSLGVAHRQPRAGEVITKFAPIQIFVLHPSKRFIEEEKRSANEGSLSLRVSFGEVDALFLGDIEKDGEAEVRRLGTLLDTEILKVSHHGSKTSSTDKFLELATPAYAVISVAAVNKFGHPHQEVIDRLRTAGATILRTDVERAILMATDGRRIERIEW